MAHRALSRFFLAPLALLAGALLLSACQAIFTYSPLSSFQRPPSSMTPQQRLTYAKDALASGNTAIMKAAYDALKNDTSAEAQYTTAQLGIELSGVSDVLVQIASDPSTVASQLSTIDAFITAHNLDPTYMVAAAGQLAAAAAAGAVLTTMDYAMGSMGLLLGYAHAASGTWNITAANITDPQRDAAGGSLPTGFLYPAVQDVASLPSGDPLKDFITQLNSFISTL